MSVVVEGFSAQVAQLSQGQGHPLAGVGLEIGEPVGVIVHGAEDLQLDGARRAGEGAPDGQVHPVTLGWPPRLDGDHAQRVGPGD